MIHSTRIINQAFIHSNFPSKYYQCYLCKLADSLSPSLPYNVVIRMQSENSMVFTSSYLFATYIYCNQKKNETKVLEKGQ